MAFSIPGILNPSLADCQIAGSHSKDSYGAPAFLNGAIASHGNLKKESQRAPF